MNRFWRVAAAMAVSAMLALPASASSRKEELRKTESERQTAAEKADALADKLEAIERERNDIKSELVEITRTLQRHERKLQKIEKREMEINAAIKAREASLKQRKKELEAMMAAAVRLSQVPPEAGLMMPEYSEQTVEAASSLKMMTQSIKTRSEVISKEMVALEKDKAEAEDIGKDLDAEMVDILKKRKELDAAYKEKNKLAAATSAEQKEQARLVKKLASESGTLKQLINSLDKAFERSSKTKSAKGQKVSAASNTGGKRGKLRSFASAKGGIHPPGSGQVIAEFSAHEGDEHSKGVMIETASNATISAPYDAEVVYNGAFRRYGNMVILKHSDGFHTLIAGLEKIRTNTGEFLLEGEPIGAMGGGSDSRQLYVELRKNNQPIDPSNWFEGL